MGLNELMKGGISDLMHENAEKTTEIELKNISPDPNQPRKLFDEESLAELAASIKVHGVLQPISVRESDEAEKYIINFGERRYKAALMATLTHIPVVINNDVTPIAQMVENLNRADLSLMERVNFIDKLIKDGYKQKEISKQIGKKDNTWVSRHVTVSKAPQFIIEAIEDGRICSLEVAQSLASYCKKEMREDVMKFVNGYHRQEQITSMAVRSFISKLKQKQNSNDKKKANNGIAIKKTLQKLSKNERDTLQSLLNDNHMAKTVASFSPEAIKALSKIVIYLGESGDTVALFDAD